MNDDFYDGSERLKLKCFDDCVGVKLGTRHGRLWKICDIVLSQKRMQTRSTFHECCYPCVTFSFERYEVIFEVIISVIMKILMDVTSSPRSVHDVIISKQSCLLILR